MHTKIIVIIFLLLVNFAALSQTCIVIYVSHKGIVAGADRKYQQTITGADEGHSVFYGKKIFITGNYAWALAGADYYDTIHTICKDVCRNNVSLNSMLKNFRKRMNDAKVKTAMHQLFAVSNDEQKKRFKGNMVEVVFFRFEDNTYKAYRITLSMPGIYKNNETLHFETDSIVAKKNTVGLFVLGHYESFADNMHPEQWTDPAATIRRLIKRQARFTPAEVGPESDVLKVSKTGFNWIAQP